nr:hypothetical protein [Treponema denticola]
MKTQKKLFVFAVLLMAASLVFAQTSMTSYSTQGLFGTDVDDFMNVNEWQNVQPKNIFGFLGYNTVNPEKPIADSTQKVGNGALNLGFAHQFKPFYLGTYFEGQLSGWKSEKKTNGDTETKIETAKKANGKLLFGFGNVGVMTDISYDPDGSKKTTWTESTKTKFVKDKFKLDFNLMAGMNLNLNNKLFKISAKLGLESDVDKETTKKDKKLTNFEDKSKYDLVINAGFSHDLSSKDGLTHTVLADLDTKWRIWPTTRKIEVVGGTTNTDYEYGELKDIITLTPKYQIAYEPEGKFAFKAEAGLGIGFDFANDYNYKRRNSEKKMYNTSRNYNTTLSLKPAVKTAFTYAPHQKFKLNFGLGFKVPEIGWAFTKTETRDSDGNVKETDRGNTFTFTTKDGKFDASSGFTWLITENITLDAYWALMGDLFDDFTTKLTNSDNLWITINKIAVHKIGFAVSAKF